MSVWALGINHNTAGKIHAFFYSGINQTPSGGLISTTVLTSGAWVHIAFVRASGVATLYINGIAEATAAAASSINTPASRVMEVGRLNGTNYAAGHMDGLRLTKGYARYTATFTPDTALFEVSPTGTAEIDVSAPMPTVFVAGAGSIDFTMPMPTLEFTTAMRADLTAPMPTVDMTGRNTYGENAIDFTMPMPTVEMRLGVQASVSAPMPTVEFEVTTTIMVVIDVTAPMPSLAMSVTTTGLVSIQATAPMPSVDMLGGARLAATAPMPTVDIEGTTGSTLTIVASAPMAEVAMEMSSGGTMSFAVEVPMPVAGPWGRIVGVAPMARVEIIASSVVVVTYEAYAVNLKPGPKMPNQVTRYTNYPFNQILRFQGRHIGVADDGLYELGGDTDYDATTPAGPAWAWYTGETDFNSPQKKNVREAMFAGRLGPSATASVSVREAVAQTYDATIVRGSSAQNHRIKYGRGLSARYWSFGWSDPDGGTCEPDAIEFEAAELGRKL